MTKRVDPNSAYVISVGLERYEYGEAMDLPGAADEAVRFARWARSCGVPPDRVRVGCSWTEGRPRASVGTMVGTTLQALENEFTRAADLGGELLLVYWCGHGVLNSWFEQALFTSDAVRANKRVLVVDELMHFLASSAVRGFNQQFLMFDACANFVEGMRLEEQLARGAGTLSRGKPKVVEQFVAYSASQGQIAEFNRTERLATFSNEALQWLETKVLAGLPPDSEAFAKHMDHVFENLRAGSQLRQKPVYRRVRFRSGEDNTDAVGSGMPVPGSVHAKIRHEDMSVSQAWRIAHAAMESTLLQTPQTQRALATALKDDAGPGVGLELIDSLMLRIAAGESEARGLFRALREAAGDSEEQLLEVARIEVDFECAMRAARVPRMFPSVTRKQVLDAFAFARPSQELRRPDDLDDALEILSEHPRTPNRASALDNFVARLAHLSHNLIPDEWYKLSQDRLNALRHNARLDPDAATAHLVIAVPSRGPRPGKFVWPDHVLGYVRTPRHPWERRREKCDPSLAGVQAASARLVDAMYAFGSARFTLGFMFPREAIDELPESWIATGDELAPPTKLGLLHPIVLHSAERFGNVTARAAWSDKVRMISDRLQHQDPDLDWDVVRRDEPHGIHAAVGATRAACVGLPFALGQFGNDPRVDPFLQVVRGGAPYILWMDAEPDDWDVAKATLEDLLTSGSFESLPMRIGSLRKDDQDSVGRLVRLVWDHPTFLPEQLEFTGIAVAKEHA